MELYALCLDSCASPDCCHGAFSWRTWACAAVHNCHLASDRLSDEPCTWISNSVVHVCESVACCIVSCHHMCCGPCHYLGTLLHKTKLPIDIVIMPQTRAQNTDQGTEVLPQASQTWIGDRWQI